MRITSKNITNAERVPFISFPVLCEVLVCCAFYFDFITKIVSKSFCCFENNFRLAKIWNFCFIGFVSSVLMIIGTFPEIKKSNAEFPPWNRFNFWPQLKHLQNAFVKKFPWVSIFRCFPSSIWDFTFLHTTRIDLSEAFYKRCANFPVLECCFIICTLNY